MTLYHGSTERVELPHILFSEIGRDFGMGFYTTNIRQQAEKWAKRQAYYRKRPEAILNLYQFDESALKSLCVKSFEDYGMEWIDLVVAYRKDSGYQHGYDLVCGKIADDDVGETVQAVIDGLTSKEFALSKLTFFSANNQICFCTERALQHLHFLSAERLG